jgi:hypothetical protein
MQVGIPPKPLQLHKPVTRKRKNFLEASENCT